MRVSKNIGIVLGLAVAGLGGTTSAMAQTSMQASAKMAATCEISSPSIAYGALTNLVVGESHFKQFYLSVKCSKGQYYSVSDTQPGFLRPMTGEKTGVNTRLQYGLYRWSGSLNKFLNFGTQADGAFHYIQEVGTGDYFLHQMQVAVRATDSLPDPDNYSASTTIAIVF